MSTETLEQRIIKKLCDTAGKHATAFAPDFGPTVCVCVVPLAPSGGNNSAPLRKRLAFSSVAWPPLPQSTDRNAVANATMRLDVAACLVAACNVSDTIAPAPWPSFSGTSNNADDSPLKLGLSSIVDSGLSSNTIHEVAFPKCSARKSAARSFAFSSVAQILAAIHSSNVASSAVSLRNTNGKGDNTDNNNVNQALASLRALHSVNANVLVSYTNQWLATVSSSCTPSGSASIAIAFVIGIRLCSTDRLWASPHLRATAADAEAILTRQRQLQLAKDEKTRTHVSVVLKRPKQKDDAALMNNNGSDDDDDDHENENLLNAADFDGETCGDPWALRGGVWVVHSTASKLFQSSSVSRDAAAAAAATEQQQQQKHAQQQRTAQQQHQQQLGAKKVAVANSALANRLQRIKATGARVVSEDAHSNSGSAGGGGAGAGIDDDVSFQVEVAIVSLRCPLSLQIMTVPVKGSHCEHDACFELSTYVLNCMRDNSWNCPHCDRQAFFVQLHVDDVIESALKSMKQLQQQQNKDGTVSTATIDRTSNGSGKVVLDRVKVFPASAGRPRRWEQYEATAAAAATTGGTNDSDDDDDRDDDGGPRQRPAAAATHFSDQAAKEEEVVVDDD